MSMDSLAGAPDRFIAVLQTSLPLLESHQLLIITRSKSALKILLKLCRLILWSSLSNDCIVSKLVHSVASDISSVYSSQGCYVMTADGLVWWQPHATSAATYSSFTILRQGQDDTFIVSSFRLLQISMSSTLISSFFFAQRQGPSSPCQR